MPWIIPSSVIYYISRGKDKLLVFQMVHALERDYKIYVTALVIKYIKIFQAGQGIHTKFQTDNEKTIRTVKVSERYPCIGVKAFIPRNF